MALPFPGTAPVTRVENGFSLGSSDQDLRNKFWEDVQRRVEQRKRARRAAGSAQPLPPTPPPVQPPRPPSPPPPPAHQPWAKRPATSPPPGLSGVHQPPPKQYQRLPPGQRAPAQPQQPAPNAQRTPGPPPVNPQWARRDPQPAPARAAMSLPLQRRFAPKPPRPAAKKKPTVPCALCGVLCMTAWHLEQHELGRKHRNKVACLAGEMSVRCQVCNVYLSGALNVQQHYAGKQHVWRLNGGA